MKIALIGGGTWGLALAQVLADNRHEVILYARKEETVKCLNETHKAPAVFKEHIFPDNLKATANLESAVKNADGIVLAVPTSSIYDVLVSIKPFLNNDTIVINTAKGFERSELSLPSAAISKIYGNSSHPPVSLIGPSHAEEVVQRKLTCICSVCTDKEIAETVQSWFSNSYLRVYTCTDPIGSEVGAAIKNVIALASGMADGLGIGGDNAKAALVTRGIQEILRFGEYKGGKKNTFFGLTGVGDLIVTCFSIHSRNYRAGLAIGMADDVGDFLNKNTATVEGIFSCMVVAEEAKQAGIEMPLVEAVYNVLFKNEKPSRTVRNVMLRPLKEE